MTLTDQDKRDLLGWESGLGDASSNARAQQLLQLSGESIEFLQQLKTIKERFQPPQGHEVPAKLSDVELSAITEAVLNRADRIRQRHTTLRLRRIQWATALAACIAVLILPSFWIFSSRIPVIGETTFLDTGSKLQAYSDGETGPNIVEGSIIKSGNRLAIISFRNAQRMTLDVMTTIRVTREDHIELQQGSLLIEVPHSTEINLADAGVRLDNAKAIIDKMPEGFNCHLSQGQATIRMNNRDYHLLPGQRAVWKRSDNTMNILQRDPRPTRLEAATQPQ